jgi:hypothetical protein
LASTEPLTGVTVQDQSDAATGGTQIGNLAKTIAPFTVPRFATTGARDTAYNAYVTAGGTMADGMLCIANGVPYRRIASNWRINQPRIIVRTVVITGGAGSIVPGGSAETGVTSGITLTGGNNFTLYEAATVSINAAFRAGGAGGGALCYVKIDSATATNVATSRTDGTVPAIGALALTAGSHSISMRVDANSTAQTWVDGIVVLTVGTAE